MVTRKLWSTHSPSLKLGRASCKHRQQALWALKVLLLVKRAIYKRYSLLQYFSQIGKMISTESRLKRVGSHRQRGVDWPGEERNLGDDKKIFWVIRFCLVWVSVLLWLVYKLETILPTQPLSAGVTGTRYHIWLEKCSGLILTTITC